MLHARTTPARTVRARGTFAAALVLAAGTVTAPAWSQAVVPPPPAPAAAPQGAAARAQQAPRAFLDEAVTAPEAISRAGELADAGNFTEAVRVLQEVMDTEGSQLVPTAHDRELFRPVRDAIREVLVASPQLLEKYRAEQGPVAQAALEQGEVARVLLTRWLTTPGLDAALRTAQEQLEAARFEACRLTLEAALTHPDCAGVRAGDASRIAARLAAYLPRPDVRTLVEGLAAKSGGPAPVLAAAVALPMAERVKGRGPFDAFTMPPWEQLSTQPLQSVALATQPEDRRPWGNTPNPDAAWVFPTLADETLYVCDDQAVAAYDAATLAQVWRTTPAKILPVPSPARGDLLYVNSTRMLEDVSSPAVSRNTVVAVTGLPTGGERQGDGRIHALRASDGALLWSVNPRYAESVLESGVMRGPPVIEADTVVVGVRKPGTTRRVISLYLVGIDLTSGQVRWTRLVGSIGAQVWGRSQARPDASTLADGIVYRGDDMGVLGAFNATTGEALWVRQAGSGRALDPNQGLTMQDDTPAFEVQKPVVVGGSLFFVEPGEGGVMQVDRATGAVAARREAAELGAPSYIVQVGERLALVARNGVAFVPIADFAKATPVAAATDKFDRPVQFTGRAVAMDGMLCVPTASGVVVIDSANPTSTQAHALPRSGNIVVPTGTAGQSAIAHAVVADNAGVHTFLSWEKAKATLESRVTRDPGNPAPVLTYLQLALRQGKADLAPALADQALTLIGKTKDSALSEKHRSDLFDLLHASITASRGSLVPEDPGARASLPEFPLPALKDAALLGTLADRLLRAAETPRQRTLALLDRAFLRSYAQQHELAVEDLQEVLADPSLASLTSAELGQSGTTDASATAGTLAGAAIAEILLSAGPGPYRAFDDEAAAMLATLDRAGPAQTLADTARRYALAATAPAMWSIAADAAAREQKPALARECLARGVESAILSRRIGREARPEDAGKLASALLVFATNPADQEPALMQLSRLAAAAPETAVAGDAGSVTLPDALAPLRRSLLQRGGMPAVGAVVGDRVQAVEDWRPATSLQAMRSGEATSLVPMVTRDAGRAAVFAPSMSDGRLAPLWQRECDVAPTFVRVTTDATVLYFPRSTDATIEAVSNIDGSTLWKSPPLPTLFKEDGQLPADRVARLNTPLDGLVRSDDLLFTSGGDTLVLARRDAYTVAISLRDGAVLWRAALPMDRVFDIDCAGGLVAAAGARPNATIREALEPTAAALDLTTGKAVWSAAPEALGEHARWVRLLPDGGALLGSSDKVLRLSAKGAVSWSNGSRPMRNTGAAWVCGGSAFVLDDAYDLRVLNLATGDGPDRALDDMGRLRLPFDIHATRDHLTVSSEEGLIVFDGAGEIVGIDAIETPGTLAPALLCDNAMVSVQVFPREDLNAGIRTTTAEARVLVFSFPDAKLLAQRRISLLDDPESIHAADGKLLIDQGSFTTVVDLRP